MKVIQIPFCFYPDPVGGTETYTLALSNGIQNKGPDVIIAAPGGKNESYFHDGIKVRRFAVSEKVSIDDLYGEGDPRAAEEFARILDEEKPDIVHLHAFTSAVSLKLVKEIKKRGIKIFFTYHTPTVSCQRGTLMMWGKKICDGRLKTGLCARCALHGLGLPRGIADILSLVPAGVDNILKKARLSGGVWTVLRMPGLIALRHAVFHEFMAKVDRIITLCNWTNDLLLLNGIPVEKIRLIKHGIPADALENRPKDNGLPAADRPLSIAYLGRLNPTKGVDTLIRAVKSLSDDLVGLHIYGIAQEGGEKRYLSKLERIAGSDKRIIFEKTIPNNRVIETLKKHHLLAVPSQWLETGPLVALEAFYAGIPVIGSNLGGIAELVTHEVNGLLAIPSSVTSWRRSLKRILRERDLLTRLRRGIKPVRTAELVAEETISLYKDIMKVS